LAKKLNLFGEQDIQLGNKEFDKRFIVQSDNVEKTKSILNENVQVALIGFLKENPKVFSQTGKLNLYSTHVEYNEGPYTGEISPDILKKSNGLKHSLLEIVSLIETSDTSQ